MIVSFFRTALVYLALIFTVRLMGKRQVGQMEPSEFVVTMLIANLAAIPMQDPGVPVYAGLVPILTVLALELVLSFLTLRSLTLRRLLCGKPAILIDNGKICLEALARTRVTLDELTGQLRAKDVMDIRSVQYAILETNGSVSVFLYPSQTPATAGQLKIPCEAKPLPVTLVADGRLYKKNLALTGKSKAWLTETLASRKLRLGDVLLMTLDAGGETVLLTKEGTK